MFTALDINVKLIPCPLNAQIQSQHEGLFSIWTAIASKFNEANGVLSPNDCVSFLYDLREYAGSHFALEELWHAEHSWDKAEEHKVYHETFIQMVNNFPTLLWSGSFKTDCVSKMLIQLRDWLVCHTSGADTEFYLWLSIQE